MKIQPKFAILLVILSRLLPSTVAAAAPLEGIDRFGSVDGIVLRSSEDPRK
jgi:hypothetical protein